jgi:hypothetical protein
MQGEGLLQKASNAHVAAKPPVRRPPPGSDPQYRGVPEADIVALLMSGGFPHQVADGQTEEARDLASEALNRWVRAGLAHEMGAEGRRRFDPAEVINGFKWAGLQGRDDFWRDHWIATGRRLTRDLAAHDQDGRALVRASLVRKFNLAALPQRAELLVRAPVPLSGPDHLLASLEPEVSGPVFGPLSIEDGRITARLRRGAAVSATLGWTATLAPYGAPAVPPSLTAIEAELYLRPVEGLVRVSSQVRDLAIIWAGGLSGWEAVVAFWRQMHATLCVGVIGYEQFDVAEALGWVIDHGWCDCLLGSALLVSLCRSRGLPARLVSGHFLYPLNLSMHTWAEVWIDDRGWTPIDLAAWDLSEGGADLIWRDVFLGRINRRIVTERPPRRITGPTSARLPRVWRILQRRTDSGYEISAVDAGSGQPFVTDRLCLELAPDRAG